ncbi:DUF6286 domain-containing protein [Streptomyces calidiresistens]|uniref:DUF6286 domain-containing protein n=1 Tax=Streptomyces calidiresistens TaxID=1485586 RepID=A0A7W3T184_9ACTN|nr:DUF6286 domain-containing protein [Streptomyces calidiresistens]MBB0229047.1 hypothetical protein [Streptomyces calidiresistens]
MDGREREETGGGPAVMEKHARPQDPPEHGSAGGPRAHRFRAARRVPAALTALVLLVICGALLYDVIAVRAGRSAAGWRTRLADELATRPVDDPAVLTGAAVAVLLGLWLLVLALTPGMRGLLPLHREDRDLRVGIERSAVARVVRDRAVRVAGVRSARVAVGRRRVRVTAETHFRDPEEVRTELRSVLEECLEDIALAHRPALNLRVRRSNGG